MAHLTLDWDALTRTVTAKTALKPLEEALLAWSGHGWEIRVRTAGALQEAEAALAELGLAPVQVELRHPLLQAAAADGAVVEPGATVGGGARIWRFTHVRTGAHVGEESNVGQGCYIDAGALIGARCKLQNGVNLYRGVVLGDGVFVGPAATFTNDLHPRAEGQWRVTPTLVGAGASIGANATIVCGSHLGPYAMVGAGAVVTRPVPAYGLAAGVPARLNGWVCACGERAEQDGSGLWRCKVCGEAIPVQAP